MPIVTTPYGKVSESQRTIFAKRVKELREEHGLSADQMLYELKQRGVVISTVGTIYRWEKGLLPNWPKLKQIADFFSVTPGYLLGESEEKDYGNVDMSELKLISAQDIYVLHGKPVFIIPQSPDSNPSWAIVDLNKHMFVTLEGKYSIQTVFEEANVYSRNPDAAEITLAEAKKRKKINIIIPGADPDVKEKYQGLYTYNKETKAFENKKISWMFSEKLYNKIYFGVSYEVKKGDA